MNKKVKCKNCKYLDKQHYIFLSCNHSDFIKHNRNINYSSDVTYADIINRHNNCIRFEQKPISRLQQIGIAIFKFICNPLKFISWRR
jgi:hypothetical protein